jgi:hypothetical protein
MKQYSLGLAAALTVAVATSQLKAQHFDEPSVMNQPHTQMAQDPYFGDYEGTYSAGEDRPEPGSPKPVRAEAKVRALANVRHHLLCTPNGGRQNGSWPASHRGVEWDQGA